VISKTGTTSSFEPRALELLAISKIERTSSFERNSGTVQVQATLSKTEITQELIVVSKTGTTSSFEPSSGIL
jgi:uncharacterized membrane protein